jgi:sporulation protein YlmC with PRC-barrel domain
MVVISRIALAMVVLSVASTGPARAEENPPVAGKTMLGVAYAELDAVAIGYRASKLIGASVYNDKDERIGKVGDIIVKPDGAVSFAIVDVGGFLGLGKHHVAIPVGQFSGVKPRIVLPGATREALEELPAFEYAVDAQLQRDAAALKSQLEQLKAQRAQAAQEDRAKLDAKIEAVKAELRATQGRVKAQLAAEKEESEAKMNALNVKIAKAGADAEAKREARIAKRHVEHERRSKLLHEAWDLTKQALAD